MILNNNYIYKSVKKYENSKIMIPLIIIIYNKQKLARINCQDINGQTPILYAVKFQQEAAIDALLKFNPDLNIAESQDVGGKTPLIYAVIKNNLNIVRTLLEYGASIITEVSYTKILI